MNLRETAEIAALLATGGMQVIESPRPLPDEALQQYWSLSKQRLQAWRTLLDSASAQPADFVVGDEWTAIEAVISEVYATEMWTRIWGAVLTARDRVQRQEKSERLARSILLGHLDARRAALRLLIENKSVSDEQLAKVDLLRRRIERWTDVLIGHLVQRYHVGDFAYDAERALDFGADHGPFEQHSPVLTRAWKLLTISLRIAFAPFPRRPFPHGVLDGQIAQSMLVCLPGPAGLPRPQFSAEYN